MATLKRIWAGWLDLLYGKARCKYGVRLWDHGYFNTGCKGCYRDMWYGEDPTA